MKVTVDYSHRSHKSMARTLSPDDLGYNQKSGWTVTGLICEDYYQWVNDFEATHPDYGWVKGDFEVEVTASSKKALRHFLSHYTPDEWDYGDI